MPPRKKAGKRNRDPVGPPTAAKTHSVRDAIVAFGAGYNALSIPVERRVARYLRFDQLYAVGGVGTRALSSVECYDPATNVWSVVAAMTTTRVSLQSMVIIYIFPRYIPKYIFPW